MELCLFISKIHVILHPCSLIETGAECMQERVFCVYGVVLVVEHALRVFKCVWCFSVLYVCACALCVLWCMCVLLACVRVHVCEWARVCVYVRV